MERQPKRSGLLRRSVAETSTGSIRGIKHSNAAYSVPQGTLRLLAVGADQRPATPTEIRICRKSLHRVSTEGAVGMSSGLTYTPGMYADTAELAALWRWSPSSAVSYAPHTRSYGAGALEAYAEMIDLARSTGCALHLTHATMNFGVNRGRASEFLDMVDVGLADGADITLDTYPYPPPHCLRCCRVGPCRAVRIRRSTVCRIRRPAHESPRTST